MPISDLFNQVVKTVKANLPEILTALGASGVVTTAYLASKASFKSADAIHCDIQEQKDKNPGQPYFREYKDNVKLVWKNYIPAGVSCVMTIGCIIGASKANGRRTAAAMTAYSLTERAFSQYKEKVVEEIGKGKEQRIRDTIVQERVTELAPCEKDVVILGNGQVLCCELFTDRFFRSDMETLRKAENAINATVLRHNYVSLDEFYDLIGLKSTSVSGKIGWDFDALMELKFSTVLSPTGEPCLAFDYNYTKPLR